jgi:hypothetical protein
MNPEWVSAIAESVTAVGLVLVLFQVALAKDELKLTASELKLAKDELTHAKKQLEADHERSRRQTAIEACLTWTTSLTPATSSTRRLVDGLSDDQCKRLEHIEEFRIDSIHQEQLKSCFTEPPVFQEINGNLCLTKSQASEIRYRCIKYLNTLESILSSWHHNVADRTIIEAEFSYMLAQHEGHTLLKKFRIAAGESNFPAILAFEAYNAKKRGPVDGKGPLGQ